MFDFIAKFIGQFFFPAGLVALLLFIALFKIQKKPKCATWLVVAALLIVAVLGNTYFSAFITRSMEWRHMPPVGESKADAIVVLAGGVVPANTPRQMVELGEESDRLTAAARLYKAEAAPVIIVSGGWEEANQSKTVLLELGVPVKAIEVQNQAMNTEADAKITGQLLEDKTAKSIILVTSAAYMDRALFSFGQENVKVIPMPVDYQVTAASWDNLMVLDPRQILLNLMPTTGAFDQSSAILREYVTLMFYRVKTLF